MQPTYAVYEVKGNLSHTSYYGYCQLNSGTAAEEQIIEAVEAQAARTDGRRLVDFISENDGDISYVVRAICNDEGSAFIERNILRSNDRKSISLPTTFPYVSMHRDQISKAHIEQWQTLINQRSCHTAREAWALKYWSNEEIKSLTQKFDREQIVRDLDALTPDQFQQQYF